MQKSNLTLDNFLNNFVNASIVITIDNAIRHEFNTLSYQQIKNINQQCERAENNFFVFFHYDHINYLYSIIIGDPESEFDITIDLYSNDQQIWGLKADEWYFKPTKTYLPIIGKLPHEWDLIMMFFKMAKWGELYDNIRLKKKYYALSLWLISDFVQGDFQKLLKNEILQQTDLVNCLPFYDLAKAELEFCRKLYFYSPEVKNYGSAELIWLCLQFSGFGERDKQLNITKPEAVEISKNYINWHRKMISDKSLRQYRKINFNCLNNELITNEKELNLKDFKSQIRTVLLNDAFQVILENIDNCKDIVFHTRKYLDSLAHFNRMIQRNRKFKIL